MTTWEKGFDNIYQNDSLSSKAERLSLIHFITALLASERADWLRSEIERLEGAEKRKSKIGFEKPGTKMQQIKQRVFAQGHNRALTSIITRYKEVRLVS